MTARPRLTFVRAIFGVATVLGLFSSCQAYQMVRVMYPSDSPSVLPLMAIKLGYWYAWALMAPVIVAVTRRFPLERGRWIRPADVPPDELTALSTLYKDGGAQINSTLDFTVLQGTCVGGSTLLANVVCFRLPEGVRRRYAAGGFELEPDSLAASYARVESVLGMHETEPTVLNPVAFRLEQGMRALGMTPTRFRFASIGCSARSRCSWQSRC